MVQAILLNTWGGRRPGAGRPSKNDSGVSHLQRARLTRHQPVHVSARLQRLPSLRHGKCWKVVRRALVDGCQRPDFRVVEFSVQATHLHLICEAADNRALARGLQGLFVRIARRLNKALGRSGPVFADRYHDNVLKTPREVRNAIAYVLNNARKHAWEKRRRYQSLWTDSCSSALRFFGGCGVEWLPEAKCWLLQIGWKRAGPVRIDEIPAKGTG